jgi:AcrR family transcriptional regulator
VGRPPRSTLGDAPDRRTQIIEAATRVLGERGYGRTSLKDIAAAAGVTPALIYHYFESKEDLLLSVMAEMQQVLHRRVDAAGATAADPLEAIARRVDRAAAEFTAQPGINRMLLDLYGLGLTQPAIRERGREMLELGVRHQAADIERFYAAAGVPPGAPPEDLAGVIVAAFDGIAISAAVRGVDADPLYRALKLLLMSAALVPLAAAGGPLPLERLARLMS